MRIELKISTDLLNHLKISLRNQDKVFGLFLHFPFYLHQKRLKFGLGTIFTKIHDKVCHIQEFIPR